MTRAARPSSDRDEVEDPGGSPGWSLHFARVGNRRRFAAAGGLTGLGGGALFGSLFLVWSHQYGNRLVRVVGRAALTGVPRDATAWQVYSAMDVLLCVLAAALVAAAVAGERTGRVWAATLAVLVGLAIAFVLHALAVPPTNGLLLVAPGTASYVRPGAGAGPGETVALAGLIVALVGLGCGLFASDVTAIWPRRTPDLPSHPSS